MSRNRNMQLGRQNDEIPLIPYQVVNFLDQEQQLFELAAQVSARLAVNPGRGGDLLHDNTLASAWYRMHPEDIDDETRPCDEVGGQRLIYSDSQMSNHRVPMNHLGHRDRGVVQEGDRPGYHQQRPLRRHLKPHPRDPLRLKGNNVKTTPVLHSSPTGTGRGRGYKNNGTKQPAKLGLLR